jgi:hypothetical protein
MVFPLPVVPPPAGPLAVGDDGGARSVEPRAEPAAAGEPVPPEALPAVRILGWLVVRSQQWVWADTLPAAGAPGVPAWFGDCGCMLLRGIGAPVDSPVGFLVVCASAAIIPPHNRTAANVSLLFIDEPFWVSSPTANVVLAETVPLAPIVEGSVRCRTLEPAGD